MSPRGRNKIRKKTNLLIHFVCLCLLCVCVCACYRGNHKVEDACEMYARAANMFKMAKNWSGRPHTHTHTHTHTCVYTSHTHTA